MDSYDTGSHGSITKPQSTLRNSEQSPGRIARSGAGQRGVLRFARLHCRGSRAIRNQARNSRSHKRINSSQSQLKWRWPRAAVSQHKVVRRSKRADYIECEVQSRVAKIQARSGQRGMLALAASIVVVVRGWSAAFLTSIV